MIDLSLIPSLQCNIECPFCMYSAGPLNTARLDFNKTKAFIKKIDWNLINSIGFYGGEPSINLPLYQRFIDLIPISINKFIISNGTWSNSCNRTREFVDFLKYNELFLVVSGTPYHKNFQNEAVLAELDREYPGCMRLKGDDTIYPMGRAASDEWNCSKRCKTFKGPTRLGLFPGGNILLQSCDGVYQKVQTYKDDFIGILDRIKIAIKSCEKGENK